MKLKMNNNIFQFGDWQYSKVINKSPSYLIWNRPLLSINDKNPPSPSTLAILQTYKPYNWLYFSWDIIDKYLNQFSTFENQLLSLNDLYIKSLDYDLAKQNCDNFIKKINLIAFA